MSFWMAVGEGVTFFQCLHTSLRLPVHEVDFPQFPCVRPLAPFLYVPLGRLSDGEDPNGRDLPLWRVLNDRWQPTICCVELFGPGAMFLSPLGARDGQNGGLLAVQLLDLASVCGTELQSK